jgi:hypothetical protein
MRSAWTVHSKTLPQKKEKRKKRVCVCVCVCVEERNVTQIAEHLLNHKTLSSNSSTTKTKKVLFCFIFLVLAMEPRALHVLGKHATTELYPKPHTKLLKQS